MIASDNRRSGSRPESPPAPVIPSARLLPFLSVALAAGLGLNAILGPLALGVIDYRYTETFRNQGIGLDAFAIVIVGPLLLAASVLALRSHPAAPFLALAAALMAAYMLPQYVLGAHYATIEGNNEDFFAWHLGLLILSLAVAVLAWNAVEAGSLPRISRRRSIWTGVLLALMAGFLVVRYAPALMEISAGTPPAEYVDDAIAFWLIAMLDLGIVMPAAAATGVALLRGVAGAQKGMYAIVGWFALVGPAVASMSIAMVINDDPHASTGIAIAFALLGAVFAVLAAYVFQPLFAAAAGTSE